MKLAAWIIIVIFALPVILALLLNVGLVQNFVVDTAASFLSRKLETVVSIDNFHFRGFSNLSVEGLYIQDYSSDTLLYVNRLSLDLDKNAIFRKKIVLDDVSLDSTKIYLRSSDEGMNLSLLLAHFASDPNKEPSDPISIRLNNVDITDSRFILQQEGSVSQKGQVDFANLIFSDLNITARRIDILGANIIMDINSMSFVDRSGLVMSDISASRLVIDDGLVSLEKARIRTPDSDIQLPLFSMQADSWAEFSDFMNSVDMQVRIVSSRVSARTATYFVPSLAGSTLALDNLAIDFSGPVNDFHTELSSGLHGGDLTLHAKASLAGADNIDKARFDLDIMQLETDGNTVRSVVGMFSDDSLSESVAGMLGRIGNISLTGTAAGHLPHFDLDLKLISDSGSVKADVSGSAASGKTDFNGTVKLNAVEAGRILGNMSIGDITADLCASGGIHNGKLALNAGLDIAGAGYNGFTYDSISISGTYDDGEIVADAVSEDPKLLFDMHGEAVLGEIPYLDADIHLKSIDMYALNLIPDTLRSVLSADIRAVGSGSDPDNINADVWITDLTYSSSENTVRLDSVWLTGRNTDTSKHLALHSPLIEIDYASSVGYRQIYDYLRHILFDYLPSLDGDAAATYAHGHKKVMKAIGTHGKNKGIVLNNSPLVLPPVSEIRIPSTLSVLVKDLSPVTDIFMPGFSVADGTRLDIQFDPRTENFDLTLVSNYIEYNDYLLTRLSVGIDNTSVDNAIILNLSTEDSYVSNFLLPENHIAARVSDDKIDLKAEFGNLSAEPNARLDLAASLARQDDDLHVGLVIEPSSYVSFGRRWHLSSQMIDYSAERINIDDFAVYDTDHKILSIDGVLSPSVNDTLRLAIDDFWLRPLNGLVGLPDGSLDGKISGRAELISGFHNPVMIADIDMNELSLNGYRAAPLRLNSSWDFSNERARLALTNLNTGRDIVRGFYRPDAKFYAVTVDVDGIPLAAAEPFLPKSVVSSLGGDAAVYLELRSRDGNLSMDGTMSIADFSTTVAMTNVTYSADVLDIDVDDGIVNIPLTLLHDDENNVVSLRADADISNFSNINYRAQLVLNDLVVIDTGPGDNDVFYGKVYLSGAVNVRGDRGGVNVDVAVETQSDSEFYLPLSSKSDITEADWISFKSLDPHNIDTDDIVEFKKFSHRESLTMAAVPSEKMNVNLNVSLNISPGLLVSIIVDPATNMVLNARGSASLDVMLNPGTGDLSVFGTYEIAEGDFLFSLPPLISNRKFVLQNGGTIQLSGDPLAAVLNIEAIYRVRASLQPLAADLEGTGLNTGTRVPVDCVIKITDNLAKPDITFDIQVPSADADIQSVLSSALSTNEDRALNFLWLVGFSSFAPSGTSVSDDTAGSASAALGLDFLTNQLSNMLSTDDLSIMVRYRPQDQTSSEELDFGFSYNIGGNNRLILEVEGNYNADNSLRENSNNITGDASLTWILTPDGNLSLKGFTRTINRYDENQGLQENGIGVYYKEDFNVFGDIGRRRKQRRQERSAEKRADNAIAEPGVSSSSRTGSTKTATGLEDGDNNVQPAKSRSNRIEERREESENRRTRAMEARRREREEQAAADTKNDSETDGNVSESNE